MKNINFMPIMEQFGPVLNGPGAFKFTESFSLKRLTKDEKDSINKAKKFVIEQNIKAVLVRQTKYHETQQMMNCKRSQAMNLLCKIYIGSIDFDLSADNVKEAFTSFGSIKTVNLSYDPIKQKHLGYAFLEFEYPEAAYLVLNLRTGVSIGGRPAKIGRPTSSHHSGPLVDDLFAEAALYNRIYVGNVHSNLSSDDLRSVFEPFGEIISCQLQPDATKAGKHKGFGFIEYEDPQSPLDAISAMNLFDLGGQELRVCKAITPPNLVLPGSIITPPIPVAAAVAAASITAKVQALEVAKLISVDRSSAKNKAKIANITYQPLVRPEYASMTKFVYKARPTNVDQYMECQMENLENDNLTVRGRDARNQMMHGQLRPTIQRVMIMRNMIEQSEIDDQIEEEVFEECSKFGEVQEVKMVLESSARGYDGAVNILILFTFTESMYDAIHSMNGRYFGGRVVVAERYEQELFDAGDYSA